MFIVFDDHIDFNPKHENKKTYFVFFIVLEQIQIHFRTFQNFMIFFYLAYLIDMLLKYP